VKAEIAQSRGAYAEALAAYRQAALKATEDIENAMMELAQAQTRLRQRATVAKLADLDRLYETVAKAKGRIDIIFANAGVAELVPFSRVSFWTGCST
jgi:NAD(P)-dependent dehydrogenase (short-subunit alcohol dehydrogenase family)